MPYCCENCFAHPWLKQHVKETSTKRGICDYCEVDDYGEEDPESEDYEPAEVALVAVGDLANYFHRLISMYNIPEDYVWELGESLIHRVQWEWEVFDENYLGEDQQVKLLQDIVNSDWDDDSGEPPVDAEELYMRGRMMHTSHAEIWSDFVGGLGENPDKDIPLSYELEESIARGCATLPTGKVLFRARRGCEVSKFGAYEPYRNLQIGAPKSELVTKPGRANRINESVLYCSEEELTAIAEMRPPRGFLISVCSLRLNRDVQILDLCEPLDPRNPFITDTPLWECEIDELLGAFAEEMSRPVERENDEEKHYLATQKLAEAIRDAKIDGIRYPSALNDGGNNLVFFDPMIATIGESRLVRITKTQIEYEHEETGEEIQQKMTEQFQKRETEGN